MPSAGAGIFSYADNATAYYLPTATGWESPLAERPNILWNPVIQADGDLFGVRADRFGFNITGTSTIPVVIEACDDLTAGVWVPLRSTSLVSGSFYFTDATWADYPARYYRIRSP